MKNYHVTNGKLVRSYVDRWPIEDMPHFFLTADHVRPNKFFVYRTINYHLSRDNFFFSRDNLSFIARKFILYRAIKVDSTVAGYLMFHRKTQHKNQRSRSPPADRNVLTVTLFGKNYK